MPERSLQVRTLVHHSTGGLNGLKAPGDQYSQLASEVGYLLAQGVVELVNAPTAEDKLAVYGVVVAVMGTIANPTPWPPTLSTLADWVGPYI